MARWLAWLILAAALISYLSVMIGLPKGPLHGIADAGAWETVGFYVSQHLQLGWLASLDFATNDHFYPTGISAVFHSWAVERDLFYAILFKQFGSGPWLGYYYMLSHALLAASAYFILTKKVHPVLASIGSALLVTMNGYATHKFPDHYGVAIYHWSSLAIILDFVICHDATTKGHIQFRTLLWRVLVAILCFGQELGYIAGISLTSALVFSPFTIWGMVKGRGSNSLPKHLRQHVGRWTEEFRVHRSQCLALFGLLGIVSYFYLGILVSIFIEVKRFEAPEFKSATSYWASPKRFFVPLIEPYYSSWVAHLRDSPEGYVAGTPGFGWLLLAVSGLLCFIKARVRIYLPLMILLALYVTYHPSQGNPVMHLPWMSYARVGPRFTIIYPTILLCLGLGLFLYPPTRLKMRILSGAGIAASMFFFFFETKMIYWDRTSPPAFAPLASEFIDHMESVAQAPGEAILDWPFCFMGGNGNGVCAKWELAGAWANRKFHQKKVLGTYFARLPNNSVDFYNRFGLQDLVIKQARECLTREELDYLKLFYEYYDFAGMHLYADVIPHDCLLEIVQVFGQPQRIVPFPNMGPVHYFARDAQSRAKDSTCCKAGHNSPEFLKSRYLITKDLIQYAQDDRSVTLHLPRDQMAIYGFLIQRLAGSEIQKRVFWYDELPTNMGRVPGLVISEVDSVVNQRTHFQTLKKEDNLTLLRSPKAGEPKL